MDLALAASQRKALRIREQQKEIEEVAILQSDPMKEAVKHKFTKLEKKMDEKRARHDKAYKDYKMQLRALSDDIELLYVKEADSIKENLVATDKEVRTDDRKTSPSQSSSPSQPSSPSHPLTNPDSSNFRRAQQR